MSSLSEARHRRPGGWKEFSNTGLPHGAERMVGRGADLGVCNPPVLRGPQEPSLPPTVHSGIDLVTAGEMKELGEEAQESSRVTDSPEVLQNVPSCDQGKNSQVVADVGGRAPRRARR